MKINNIAALGLKGTNSQADIDKQAKLKKACNDFEAIILKQMLSAMRKSIPKSGLFSGGYADEMYQSMYDEELAKAISHGQGTGISDVLYDQMSGKIHTKIPNE